MLCLAHKPTSAVLCIKRNPTEYYYYFPGENRKNTYNSIRDELGREGGGVEAREAC